MEAMFCLTLQANEIQEQLMIRLAQSAQSRPERIWKTRIVRSPMDFGSLPLCKGGIGSSATNKQYYYPIT
jgi:hypothetical protein